MSAKRGERPCTASTANKGGTEQAGLRLLASLFRVVCTHQLKTFLDMAHVLANKYVLSLSSEHKYAGSTLASPQIQSLPVLSWEEQGAGRGMQISLSHGYHFTSCQSYFHLSCKGTVL